MSEKIEEPMIRTFIDPSFGGCLRLFRTENSIGLRALCRKAGMHAGNYCKIEKGELPPPNSAGKCIDLFNKIGIPPDEWSWILSRAYAFHQGKLQERFQWDSTQQNNQKVEG